MSIIKLRGVYKPKKDYKVIVKTITFNQSMYIQDTLNGIAMQNTSFPFVNVVLEDNSTDGEQNVIRLWIERECDMSNAEYYDIPTAYIVIAPHRINHNCTFAVYFHKENLFCQKEKREEQVNAWRERCKYEALCEGDDYWTDSLKLQKQYDFMENHPKHSLCFHANSEIYPDGSSNNRFQFNDIENEVSKEIMIYKGGGYMATNSMFFICDIYKDYPKWAFDAPVGDYPLMLVLLTKGSVAFLPYNMSVYRILSQNSWSLKMQTDYKALMLHKKRMFKMLKEFDRWSDCRFHHIIQKMLYDNIVFRFKETIKRMKNKVLIFITMLFGKSSR